MDFTAADMIAVLDAWLRRFFPRPGYETRAQVDECARYRGNLARRLGVFYGLLADAPEVSLQDYTEATAPGFASLDAAIMEAGLRHRWELLHQAGAVLVLHDAATRLGLTDLPPLGITERMLLAAIRRRKAADLATV